MSSVKTFLALRVPMFDAQGNITREWQDWFKQRHQKTEQSLDLQGQITATATIAGRAEPLKTTVQNVDAAGVVTANGVDLSRSYTGKHLGNIPDDPTSDRSAATANQKTGGDRGFQALDSNNRLQGSFHGNPVNTSNTPASSTTLSNDGVATAIPIAAATDNFGTGSVSDNSGSVDPGSFGTYYIFHDDPTFSGGAVIYQFSTDPASQTNAEGRIQDGKITTVSGLAKTGGGKTGGTTTGGAGGRGYIL